ncbi:hypothetical protein T12_5188 [Trichinella patagoniensis]|uniref:Uncharacterized protein n=1 Tax=Trichinella patagoniensis TaxID=990121 RepID=A0A0V0YQT4_9BILA|nr:hypothetical protein T12_5188 [Trichinella patagoniensis]
MKSDHLSLHSKLNSVLQLICYIWAIQVNVDVNSNIVVGRNEN